MYILYIVCIYPHTPIQYIASNDTLLQYASAQASFVFGLIYDENRLQGSRSTRLDTNGSSDVNQWASECLWPNDGCRCYSSQGAVHVAVAPINSTLQLPLLTL